eukprot:gene14862-15054_t
MSGNGVGTSSSVGGPGVCGDPFQGTNSNFASTASPVQGTFMQGGEIQLNLTLTANHGGKFFFRVCPRNNNLDEACFGSNYLIRSDSGQRDTWITSPAMQWSMPYRLPAGIACDTGCVLQFKWFAMQTCIEPGCDRTYCGTYADGLNMVYGSRPGFCSSTSAQPEYFANCADIRIIPSGAPVSSPPPGPSSPAAPPSPSSPSPSPAPSPPPASSCPTGPSSARAACKCQGVTTYKYYADVELGCAGAY